MRAVTILLVLPLLAAISTTANATLLAIGFESGGSTTVFDIDPTTGAGTTVGMSGFPLLNSAASDSTGTVYSVSSTDLVTIDPTTGAGTAVATISTLR